MTIREIKGLWTVEDNVAQCGTKIVTLVGQKMEHVDITHNCGVNVLDAPGQKRASYTQNTNTVKPMHTKDGFQR